MTSEQREIAFVKHWRNASRLVEKHWRNASRLVETAEELGGIDTVDQALAAAQVQATLALAAATEEVALNQGRRAARFYLRDNG